MLTTLASAGETAGPPAPDASLLSVLERVGPPPAFGADLLIDTAADRRLVVQDKCEAAGEAELAGLVSSAELEEAFAYIPALCTWVDIGLRQSASSVYVDRVMVDALLTAYDSLVLYHLHLARGGDAGGYFPAYADLLGMMLIDGPYLRRPEIRLTYRAATPEGTLEYDFVPSNEGEAVVDAIMATGLEEFAGENLLLVYAAAGREAAYHAAIEQCAGSAVPGSAAMRACLPMRIGEFALRLRE